jgi:tRNA-2-methylthio-N6-dimethylallyladenosine synthase
VPQEVKQRRFNGLMNLQRRIALAANLPYEGQTMEVLVEGPSKKDPHKLTGRTRTNKIINFPGDPALMGALLPVRVTRAGLYALDGEVATTGASLPLLSLS